MKGVATLVSAHLPTENGPLAWNGRWNTLRLFAGGLRVVGQLRDLLSNGSPGS